MGQARGLAVCGLIGCLSSPLTAAQVRADAAVAAVEATKLHAPEPESYRLERGVVVDRAGSRVYVIAADGQPGIDALDARNLQPRAHSARAVMPLLVSKGRLLALAASGAPLRLIWLDARNLLPLASCTPIDLPAFAQPSPVDGLGSIFELSADQQDGQIYVRWSAQTSYVGGVPPSPDQQVAADRHAEGVAVVDWQSGAIHAVQQPPADASPQSYGMEVPYAAGPFVRAGLELRVSVPDHAGEFDVAFVARRRMADGVSLPELSIAAPAGLAILSLDRGYLLVPQLDPSSSFTQAQLWSLTAGKSVVRFALSDPPASCVVGGEQLLFAAQNRLHSVQLTRPVRRSTRPLRSTAYTGTYPPSAAGAGSHAPLPASQL